MKLPALAAFAFAACQKNYRALRFEQRQPLRVRPANGRMIEYNP